MSEANEAHAAIVAEMRGFRCRNTRSGELEECSAIAIFLANRLDVAYKREAQFIERIVRDAIISYTEQYVNAPNDETEREIQRRAEVANNWLKQHGFAEEPTNWSKEEAPCL